MVTNGMRYETYALFEYFSFITLTANKVRPWSAVIVTSHAHQQQWQFQTRYFIKTLQHIRSLFYCKDEEDEDNHDEVIKNSTITLKVTTKIAMIMTSLYNENNNCNNYSN